jgi:hypothetical protein
MFGRSVGESYPSTKNESDVLVWARSSICCVLFEVGSVGQVRLAEVSDRVDRLVSCIDLFSSLVLSFVLPLSTTSGVCFTALCLSERL